ncbi:hypothetical protein CI109_100558 [Kwoniella shandongensis]|uniref:Uncharacterized protein n=1 Tax=Kwoniella shandongensis TaxID=1734106 RepID=A0A5M6C2Y9_9TREE|nr:uncharacterized protein CI109_003521 [Kwoniella shandongensis]KAA5528232.1 hypothetical protein CI109_003521 [Kwoniella shandongensis]
MSVLIKALAAIAPPPPSPLSREYDGFELRWKMFAFRPAAFKFEAIALSVLGLYLLLYVVGKQVNGGRAKAAIAPFQSFLLTQFTSVRPLLTSSPALHLAYASGRRSLLSLHTTIILLPIHDLPSLITHFVKSIIEPTYDGSEGLVFDLTLGRGAEGLQGEGVGVWGLVDKSVMRETKEKRWDLTFPRLTELPVLPITHALFTEHSDCTEALLKTPNVGVAELISDPVAAGVLKSLLITDVPATRPTRGALPAKSKARHIILSLYKPKNEQQVEAAKAWLQVELNIADLLSKTNVIKPEVSRKLLKTRQTVDEELNKSYKKEVDEDKEPEPTAEEKRAARKRAERAGMSEKEVKKAEELEKKREMRKLQKKQQSK